MADPTFPATGATRFELVDLERRIADRGLQLRRVREVLGDKGQVIRLGIPKATALSGYEETLIRTALLAMAERLGP